MKADERSHLVANVRRRLVGARLRRAIAVAADMVAAGVAFWLAALLRFESLAVAWTIVSAHAWLLGATVGVRLLSNWRWRLYACIWSLASVGELLRILAAAATSALVLVPMWALDGARMATREPGGTAAANIADGSAGMAVGLILDTGVFVALVVSSRLAVRTVKAWRRHRRVMAVARRDEHRVIIMGAGEVGATIARMMQENPDWRMRPVAFLDDDPSKRGLYVRGVRVVGNRHDISVVASLTDADEVLVAMRVPTDVVDAIGAICSGACVEMRVVPDMSAIVTGAITVAQLRQWRPRYGNGVAPAPVARRGAHSFSTLLVAGGAGFIGSNFVRHMLQTHAQYNVVVYDVLTYAGNPDNLLGLKEQYGGRYAFVQRDICDAESVRDAIREFGVDAIVNFAAETHVDRSLESPDAFIRTNIGGTHVLLEAARDCGVARYHQVSTDEVYGQVDRGAFSEDDPLETRSPYSASKGAGDLLVQAYFASFGVQATVTRGSNNIGPYQYPEKVVPLFVTNAIDDLPLPVYGDGGYVRDYQHVSDHCRGIDHVLHHGVPGQVYNLGAGNEVAAMDLALMILEKLGKPASLIRLVTDRAGQDRRYSLNCSKIRALGWSPEWDFDKAIERTIEWYVENEWWWRKLKSVEYWDYYQRQYGWRFGDVRRSECPG